MLALAATLLTSASAEELPDPVPWSSPVDGTLAAPFVRPAEQWLAGHRGIDLAASPDEAVTAPRAGVVTWSGVVVDRPLLVITHPGGLRTTLEPVRASVDVGSHVRQGEQVGHLTGHPGHCAPATCLHWGVRAGEDYLDPALLLHQPEIVLLPLRE